MTDYILQITMKDVAENSQLSDYTDRVLNEDGKSVTANCAVSSQVFDTLYPRYNITWRYEALVKNTFGLSTILNHQNLASGFVDASKYGEADEPNLVRYKLEEILR